MQQLTITTRKIAATETEGVHITATASTGEKIRIPWPYDLDAPEAHEKAARALLVTDGKRLIQEDVTAYGYRYQVLPRTT